MDRQQQNAGRQSSRRTLPAGAYKDLHSRGFDAVQPQDDERVQVDANGAAGASGAQAAEGGAAARGSHVQMPRNSARLQVQLRVDYAYLDKNGGDGRYPVVFHDRAVQPQDDEQMQLDAGSPMSPGMQANAEAYAANEEQQQQQPQQPEKQREKQPEEQSEAGQMPGAMDGNLLVVHTTMRGKWGSDQHGLRMEVLAQKPTDTLFGVKSAAKKILGIYGIPGKYTRCTYQTSAPAESSDEEDTDSNNTMPEREIDPEQETIASALQWNAANGLPPNEVWVAFDKREKGAGGAGGAGGAAGAAGAVDAARVAGVPAEVVKVERLHESYWCSRCDLDWVRKYGRTEQFAREEGGVWLPHPTPKGV